MLQPRHQFTFAVSAEELAEGGGFKREILVANFQPSIDYCLPRVPSPRQPATEPSQRRGAYRS